MILLAGTLLAVLLVAPLGGRLSALGSLTLRRGGLVVAAILAQVLAFIVLSGAPLPVLLVLHAASYGLAAAFVWENRSVPGLPLLSLGALSNAVVLAVNGGTMPASAAAVRAAGLPLVEDGYRNSGVVGSPHLAPLGDVFASPGWLPLHNVYSVGDLLILAGAVWVVHRTCGTVIARSPRTWRQPAPNAQGVPAAAARSSSHTGTASAGIGRLSR